MIEVIEGRGVGAGKSYMALDRAMVHWLQGGTCCISDTVEIKWDECAAYAKRRTGVLLEADQFRRISSADLQRLHEVTPPGSMELPVLIIVDEAQDAFNARDWSDKSKRPFFSWLCQSRHDDNDVIILSQAAANVDKQVRRLCTYIWIVRNTEFFPLGGKSMAYWIRLCSLGLSTGKLFIRTQLDQDGKTVLSKRWISADRGLFKCYESKAMRLKHKRAGEAVARKKLEVVRGRSKMTKFLVLGLLMVAVFGGYRLLGGALRGPSKSPARISTAPNVPVVSEHVWRDGEVVTDVLRGYCDGYLQTEKLGSFRVGERHALGYVRGVSRDCAIVLVRPGVAIKVQAVEGDWRVPAEPGKVVSK